MAVDPLQAASTPGTMEIGEVGRPEQVPTERQGSHGDHTEEQQSEDRIERVHLKP
jgi:hypothetical protein